MKEGLEKDFKKLDNNLSVKDGETNSETGKKKGKEERPPTKVVVRRLPPTMTEEEFLQQIEPLPPIDYMYYMPADVTLSPHSFCRAYLNFINQSDIFIFTQKFDGYVFVDSKGLEYPAIVEFAPFQRVPKQRPGRKKDPKAGTLESDQMYISFIEKLQAQIQENTSAGSNMKQHFFETNVNSSEENKVNTTPLLDYLRARHAERLRAREEKRKKDLERKRARDEQRKTAKKSEEESSVLKVLPSQTSNNKDRLKDKEVVKPVKKRNDERIKENKGRVGKSYAEERQKQQERREEQRKKFAASNANHKQNKQNQPNKSVTDHKTGTDHKEHNSSEPDKSLDSDSKKTENDFKKNDNVTKKETTTEKKNQYKSQEPQKHYDSNKRDDDSRKRLRDIDRMNKHRDQHRDRREDRFGVRKKGDNKRSCDRYDDFGREKYKKEHNSYKKDTNGHGGHDKKADRDTNKDKVVLDSVDNEVTGNKDVTCESKRELIVDGIDKPSDSVIELSGNENNKINGDTLETVLELKQTKENPEKESEGDSKHFVDLNQSEINQNQLSIPLVAVEENVFDIVENEINKSTADNDEDESKNQCNLESSFLNVDITMDNIVDVENVNNEKSDDICGTSCSVDFDSEEKKSNDEGRNSEEDKDKIDKGSFGVGKNMILDEVILKRRNSMEMYESKGESGDRTTRKKGGRRSSLESGDQSSNSQPLDLHDNEKRKADGDSCDSRPKDPPRAVRRIRNKDRPSIEIYRPGMGRFSKQRLEREKVLGSSTEVDSNSPSPSPTLVPKHKSTIVVNNSRDT